MYYIYLFNQYSLGHLFPNVSYCKQGKIEINLLIYTSMDTRANICRINYY